MPGQRSAVGRRARGSRLSRLTGISVVLLLAASGVAAYLITVHPIGGHASAPLSTKVVTNQTVGLVVRGPQPGSSGQLLQLRGPAGVPRFSPVTPAQQLAGAGQWTADQMGDGSYIFIFLPAGTCLAATGPASRPALALRHCDLQPDQRWRRTGPASLAEGHDFHKYANVRTGSCLTETGELPGALWGASLSACSADAPASQLIAFWWTTG